MNNTINHILSKLSLNEAEHFSFNFATSDTSINSNNPNDIIKECVSTLIDNIITQYIERQADKMCKDAGISVDDLIYASDNLKWKIFNAITNINQTIATQTNAVSDLNSTVYEKILQLYNLQIGILNNRVEKYIDYNSKPLKPLNSTQIKNSTAAKILTDSDKLTVARNLANAFLTGKAYTLKISNKIIGVDQPTLDDELTTINEIICAKLFTIINGDDSVSVEISTELDELQQNLIDYDERVNRVIKKWNDINPTSIQRQMQSFVQFA